MRRLKWMFFGQLALLLFVWLNIVLWGGRYFDSICIEGRLSVDQANIVSSAEWNKCVGDCTAEENDRVLKHHCSSFSRNFFLFHVTK